MRVNLRAILRENLRAILRAFLQGREWTSFRLAALANSCDGRFFSDRKRRLSQRRDIHRRQQRLTATPVSGSTANPRKNTLRGTRSHMPPT